MPELRSAAGRARPIDLEQALRDTFGYRLDLDLKAAPAPDATLAARILSEPGEARFGAEKQGLVSNALRAIAKKPALDEADIPLPFPPPAPR